MLATFLTHSQHLHKHSLADIAHTTITTNKTPVNAWGTLIGSTRVITSPALITRGPIYAFLAVGHRGCTVDAGQFISSRVESELAGFADASVVAS